MVRKPQMLLLLVVLIAIIASPITGCTSSQQDEDTFSDESELTHPAEEETSSGESALMLPEDEETSSGESAPRAFSVNLELSHPPKVGEAAELTLTVSNYFLPDRPSLEQGYGNYKAWVECSWINTEGSYLESKREIEIPAEQIFPQGSLDWEGSLAKGDTIERRGTVRFPKEGIWEIRAYFATQKPQRWPWYRIRLVVTSEKGELEWMKYFSPAIGGGSVPSYEWPLICTLDMSKAPRLGEPTELTWSVSSIRDIEEKVEVWIEFHRMQPGSWQRTTHSGESMLVEGDLEWEGTLKKDVPVSSSATVEFPEEGDWKIRLAAFNRQGSQSCSSGVYLNVTKEKSRWGWEEPHERKWQEGDPHPVPTEPPKPWGSER